MNDGILPVDVYLDTSLVVAALVAGSDHHRPCAAYCARLAANDCRIYFSQILWLELAEALRRLATRPSVAAEIRVAYRLDAWTTDARVRDRWLRYGLDLFEVFLDRFEVGEFPFDRPTWHESIAVMVDLRLRSLDAIHIATARRNGIRAIATADGDFMRAAGEFDVVLVRDS